MNLGKVFHSSLEVVKNNKAVILSGLGVAGVAITAILTGKAVLKSDQKIRELQEQRSTKLTTKEKILTGYKYYIPAAIVGIGTAGSIIWSNRVSAKELATVLTIAKTAESSLLENRNGIKELFGEKGLRKLDEHINENRAATYFDNVTTVYETGKGGVLCCEGFLTGTLFRANREWVRKCVNDFNARLIDGEHLCYNDFIQMLIPNIDPEILPNAGYVFGYNLDIKRRLLEIVDDSFMIDEPSDPGYIFNLRELPLLNYHEYY